MRRKLLLFLLSAWTVLSVCAQNRSITGIVTDQSGKPVANVSVRLLNSDRGTTTNQEGSFTLSVPQGARTLQFSGLNYETKEVNLGTRNNVSVSLTSTTANLDDVVVTSYAARGAIKDQISAIAKVSGDKIKNEPVSSIEQALAGKVAGVQIQLGSGVLADRTGIRIRGVNSISSSSQPLIVIDGVPQIPVTNLNGFNGGNGTRFDPMALINPNDIETIETLKDAAASVLYGSRASNGVVLITTKRGKKGAIKMNFESKVGWAKASKLPSLLNGDQFIAVTNEKAANRFGAGSPNAVIAKESDVNADGAPDRTDWNEYVYRTGMTYDNFLSFTGGSEKMSVYGSVRYLTQEGNTRGNKIKSGTTRLNLDFTPKDWLKTGLQMEYTKTLNNGILSDGLVAGTTVTGWQAPPILTPFNPNGPFGLNLTPNGLLATGNNVTTVSGTNVLPGSNYYINIIPQIDFQRNDNIAEQVSANIFGEAKLFKGLKFTTKFAIQNLSNYEDQYGSPFVNGLGFSYNGLVQTQRTDNRQWVWQNYFNYDKTFGSHRISFVGGAEYQENKLLQIYAGAANFSDPFYNTLVSGAYAQVQPGQTATLDLTGGTGSQSGIIGYFSRLAYSFQNKYFIEGALRRDGYSGFGADYQFGNFPSVSAGWMVSKEKFMLGLPWVSNLKLRASYGEVGNSRGVGANAALTLYSGSSYTILNGLGISQAGNSQLRWETAKKTDIGLDASFLNDKVSVTVDYFKNNVDNLILAAPTLYTVGIPNSSITTNIGSMVNKGIEFTVNATPILTRDFKWSASFNFTRLWNNVTSLVSTANNADIISGLNVASVGRPLGSYYLPDWAGVDAQTGNPMWYAKDRTLKRYNFGATGAGVWTDEKGTPVSALGTADYIYVDKSGAPTWYGGLSTNLSYKQFDLGVDFNYQGGNYIYNSSLAGMMTNQFSNNFTQILNRWQKPGDQTDVPRLWLLDNTANQASTRWLEKGDFLRCRTITLGYNFSRSILQSINIDNIRIYGQIFNPFIITKYSGLDPDVSTSGATQNNIQLGLDARATPQSRILTFGLNVSF